jgi:hypothetical protein
MAGRLFSYQLGVLKDAIAQLERHGPVATVLLDLNGLSGGTEQLTLINPSTMQAVEVQGRLSQFRERDLPPLRYGEGQEHSCHPAAMLPRIKGDSWQPPHPWPGEEPDPINEHLGIDAVRPEPIHPVDALEEVAARAGLETDPERMAEMRAICDQPVTVVVCNDRELTPSEGRRLASWIKEEQARDEAGLNITDPDLGRIERGHVCKHGVRWPHACPPCDDAAWNARKLEDEG